MHTEQSDGEDTGEAAVGDGHRRAGEVGGGSGEEVAEPGAARDETSSSAFSPVSCRVALTRRRP
ncbi:hypothetical protein SLA_7055 [Streptomyces laurentii]|uniref:Uncharacterized protein n=1 Tax=Streptomyces laurentii TaxID=39478 RepID=A0A160P9C5_STRLU|nr:hypothetical protein SLA_7055 [Streptomyces laurentii]